MRNYFLPVFKTIDRLGIKHIVLLAFVLRLAFALYIFNVNGCDEKVFLHNWEPRWNDCYEYLNVADNIFHHGEISTGTNNLVPYIDKPFGYPVFLLLAVYFKTLWVVVVLQILLSSLSVYYLFRIAQQVLQNERLARIVALVFAFNLQSIVYANLLLTETIYTFLLLSSIYYFLKGLSQKSNPHIYLAFLFMLTGIFIRPVAYYLYPILLAFYVIVFIVTKAKLKRILIDGLFIALLFIISIGSWQNRNKQLTEYKGFSAVSVDFLYSYIAPRLLAKDDPVKTDSIRKSWGGFKYMDNYFTIYPEQKVLSKGEVLELKKEKAVVVIKENLPFLVKLQIVGMIKTMIARVENAMLFISTKNGIITFFRWIILNSFTVLNLVILIFAAVQSFFVRKRVLGYWILLLIIVYFIAMSGFHGIERYRIPVMPIYLVIIADGFQLLWKRYRHSSKLFLNDV